jgi:hypothetical protein
MPSKEALMVKAVFALAQGCGGTEIDADACQWFYDRYFPWIGTTKSTGLSPQDVWDQYDFLEQFKEIGRRAATNGAIQKQSLEAAALAVEGEAKCPYCP